MLEIENTQDLSILERFEETQHDSARTSESFYQTARKNWVTQNGKVLCRELNGFYRIISSYAYCLKRQYSNPKTFDGGCFITDTNSYGSLIDFLISSKLNLLAYALNKENVAAVVDLCLSFVGSSLILFGEENYSPTDISFPFDKVSCFYVSESFCNISLEKSYPFAKKCLDHLLCEPKNVLLLSV